MRLISPDEIYDKIIFFRHSTVFTSDVLWTIHAVCHVHRDLASYLGKENISFRSGMVSDLAACGTYIDLNVSDGAFHNGAYHIKKIPFRGTPLES